MNTESNHTPDDIRETVSALDHLAKREADAAPPGLEDRIFLRTAASLRDPSARAESNAPAPAPIPLWNRTPFRLAAAIALVVIASLFFFIPNTPSGTTDFVNQNTDLILEELDSILAVAYATDPYPELDSIDAELSELLNNDSFSELDAWLETEEAL